MKMGNFKQLLAKQSPASQKRIAEKMEQLRSEIKKAQFPAPLA